MRVTHLDTGRELRGGQRQVLLLHRELLARGVASVVAAPAGSPLARSCRQADVPTEEVPGRRPWRPGVVRAVRRAVNGADLLHAHDPHAALLAVLTARRDQAVVCHRRSGFGMRRGAVHRLKYRRVDRWIAVTEAIRSDLLTWGVAPDCCRTVPSAIDLEEVRRGAAVADPVRVRRELGVPPGVPVVAAVGAYDLQKGFDVLVRALAAVGDSTVRVVIVGDGPERDRLEAEARRTGVDSRVVLTGWRDDVPAVLVTAAVCVVPSLGHEGSSAVVKEAMAVGCPVVASDLPGLREVAGDAARWVPPGDPDALAAAISELLRTPDVVDEIARRGIGRAEDFGRDRMVEAVLEIYRDVLGGTPL